ncbi:MAG TPA: hypothetical protein VMP12_04575 [Candidatus Sulfotelmatobacter sp.]|nr:hypothetical protein [Candidatus Sulfotelmatobacter sp.]
MATPLLDQYLNSIRHSLPEAQRDDIVQELSENIHAQIEDKEAELGRPLRDAEVEAILKQHGHPLVVASRYHQDQRSVAFGPELIGPVIFPFYLRVLKFNLGLSGIILFIVSVALAFGGHTVTAGRLVPEIFLQVAIQFVIVTLVFAAADRHFKKHPESWNYRDGKHPWHPAFTFESWSKSKAENDRGRVSRMDSVAQIVALSVGVVWLRVAEGAPFLIFGPAAAFLRPAPVWHHLYWPIVAVAFVGILQGLLNLLRPDWLRLMVLYRALTAIAWLVILYFVFKAGPWVVLSTDASQAEGFRKTAEILNQIGTYCAIVFAAIALYNLVRHLRRLVRLSSTPKADTTRQTA